MVEVFIDCTDRHKNIIRLLKDKKALDEISGEVDVVSSIEELLVRNKLKFSDVSIFSMNEGPGSFTGLRISASIVNALNFALGVKKPGEEIRPKYDISKFDSMGSEFTLP
ncbi:MAG: hypothetical protein AAB443_00745 [Patescibacteria group bacterium]